MPLESSTPGDSTRRLQEVLLAYLQTLSSSWWPGADGLTVEDALDAYVQASVRNHVPGLHELLRRHPELAAELTEFFASREQ